MWEGKLRAKTYPRERRASIVSELAWIRSSELVAVELVECRRDWECQIGSCDEDSSRDVVSRLDLLADCFSFRDVHSDIKKKYIKTLHNAQDACRKILLMDSVTLCWAPNRKSFPVLGLGREREANLALASACHLNQKIISTLHNKKAPWSHPTQCSPSNTPSKPWKRKLCKLTWKRRLLSNTKRAANSPETLHVALKVWAATWRLMWHVLVQLLAWSKMKPTE